PRPQPSPQPGAAQLTAPPEQQPPATEEEGFFGAALARVTTDVGLNRFVWDMRYPDATRFPGMILWAGQTTGPRVAPGTYLVKRVGPQSRAIVDAGNALTKKLTEVEEALYQTKNQSSQDPLNFPIRLNNKLAALLGVVARSETPPNDQSFAVYDELNGQINAQLQKLSQIMKTDVPAFNQLVKDQNIPAIVVKP